jgi:hypothetical protein
MPINPQIRSYNDQQSEDDKQLCDLLASTIDKVLKQADGKIWHRHPVWFLDGNPIVGYSKQKAGWRLMFWSGASFDEEQLDVVGKKFKDASIFYSSVNQVKLADLKRWLKKSIEIQWDYENIVKRKGRLVLREPNKRNPKERDVSKKEKTMAKSDTSHHDQRIADMTFSSVYPHLVAKVEKKGRTVEELHLVIKWLTGFDKKKLEKLIKDQVTYAEFFGQAKINPNAKLITGVICGYRVEEIQNVLTQQARYLDKLVDELAKGRKMEKILRTPDKS